MARKSKKKQKLPFGVGCLAFFLLIGSLAIVGFGVLLAMHYAGHRVDVLPVGFWKEFNKQTNIYWMIGLVQGCLGVPTAIGLFAKKKWAYNIYTIFNGFSIGLHGYGVIVRHEYLIAPVLVINTLVAIYMFMPGVRKVFA